MKEIQIRENEEGKRLDKFLNQYFSEAGSGFLFKMLRKKNIVLNKKKATGKEILKSGDIISVFFSDETFYKFANKNVKNENNDDNSIGVEYRRIYKKIGSLEIVYEDRDVLLINKPTGILSQKSKEGDLSINEWTIGYLLEKGDFTEKDLQTFRPSVCNRLDRNTSGIIICSKSLKGARECARVLKDRSLQKYYYALVVGTVKKPESIDGYLYKNEKDNKVLFFNSKEDALEKINDVKNLSEIKTSYIPVKTGRILDVPVSLLEVHLHTGKTHQIRAHLSSNGNPIIGDIKYGAKKENSIFKDNFGVKNQLLHARRLVFPDDIMLDDLKGKEFICKEEAVFKRIVENLGD